jgi:hypothetical protein
MNRIGGVLLVMVAGCSTAPLADVLDLVRPGRVGPGPYRGGVEMQHTGRTPAPIAEPAPFAPPAGPVPSPIER